MHQNPSHLHLNQTVPPLLARLIVTARIPPPFSTTATLFNHLLLHAHPSLPPLRLFSLFLRLRGSIPVPAAFPPLLKSLPSFSASLQLHSQILLRGFLSYNLISNSLLSTYSRFGRMPEARKLFDDPAVVLDVVSHNIIITGYVRSVAVEAARNVFDEMPVRDEVSWSAMIDGYLRIGELDSARGLFDKMPMRKNVVVWNSMVAGFARHRLVGLARRYFDETPERNLVSWNVMVSGYAANGEMWKARELFDSMKMKDVVSWSSMIAGYTKSGYHLEAIHFFKSMLKERDARPNEVTIVSVLSACAHLSALDQGRWIHAYIDKNKMVLDDHRNLGAALIDMYFKCGAMDSAVNVFHFLKRKNVSSWNALITGLAISGFSSEALSAFDGMLKTRTTMPNDITFVAVLTACTHGGLVSSGHEIFESMLKVYGVKPEIKHYGCMVDLLGRAGLLEEAEAIVKRMPMKPDVMVLGALLGACRIHRNVKVAERVKSEFLELKDRQAGCHVLLSNIYAAAERWAEAAEMREVLDEEGIKKEAGLSSVE